METEFNCLVISKLFGLENQKTEFICSLLFPILMVFRIRLII